MRHSSNAATVPLDARSGRLLSSALESFSGRVLERVIAGLEAGGHQVELADLHREGFQPVFQEGDYAQFEGGTLPEDILREQARVERNERLY